jgi:hypothetical protein
MRCRYCNKRLNLFKSLGGSSFCSQEHQKLYEEAEANKGLERLLQFVEKDPKSGPSKPVAAPASSPFTKPDKQEAIPVPPTAPVPSAAPVPQTIAARAIDPSFEPSAPEPPTSEPPIAGFLLESIAPADTNAGSINPNFEILEAGFPAEPAALPSYRFAVAAADHQEPADGAPPPLASWLDPALSAMDVAAVAVEVPSVGSVRPRTMDLAMPAPDNLPLAPVAPPLVFSGDASGLQLAIQAVLDTRGSRNLARLNPLLREVRTSSETAQWPAAKSVVPALSRPDALELNATPEAKAGAGLTIGMSEAALAQQLPVAPGSSVVPRVIPTVQSLRDALQLDGLSKAMVGIGVSLGMSGAMTRTGVGRNVSAPAALPPQLLVTLGTSQVHGPFQARVQDALDPGLPAVLPSRLEPKVSQAPAQLPPGAAGLPGRSFATLKVDQADQAAPIDMHGAMTRAGLAKAVRQPQAQVSRLVSALGSIEILKRVTAGVQNAPHPPDCALSPAMRAPRECVQPVAPVRAEAPAGIAPVIAPMNLTIRESDTRLAAGITNAKKPADISSPLFIPDVPTSRRSFTIGMNRTTRKVLAKVQAKDGSLGCTISPARQALRDCLLPAILWSTETWLRSAIASVGWFHASDCSVQAFPSGAPATRLFSIRFEPEPFSMDAPALGFDRMVRKLALNVCEWKTGLAAKEQEALRLARSQPSRTSPLALVTKPQPLVTRLAVRYIRNLNQFTSVANPAARGVAPSAAASASADEHQPIIALPPFAASGLTSAFRLLAPGALKSPPVEPAEPKNTEAGSRPRPSPLRVQPASMLVLPGLSIPVGGIRWRASSGWATLASPSLPKQGDVQVSSSAETSLSSLRFLAGALRVDSAVTQEFATLRLNPKPPSISLDLGAQTSAPGVPAANALPRRGGPKLPVVSAQLDDLIVAGR